MSTPPWLSLTHLKAVSISELLVTSHLTAYSLPVADCRDLDSSWDTVNIDNVSMKMLYYISSCSLMQGYQNFTRWPLLHRMSHLKVFWQTINSFQPLTHQGLCTRIHGFIFRKKPVFLVFALRTFSHPVEVWLVFARQPPVDKASSFTIFLITHNDAPHSVGLLWTNDQPDAETSTWQHTTDKDSCDAGIRTHNLSRRASHRPTL